MLRENFDKAVSWVQERIPAALARAVSANDLTSAFDALSALPARASATFLIPDLFPGVSLETLYVHDVGKHSSDAGVSDTMTRPGSVSPLALTAIGTAIAKELQDTGTDMVHYPLDGEAEVIVFIPDVRSTVLHATGTTLLTS